MSSTETGLEGFTDSICRPGRVHAHLEDLAAAAAADALQLCVARVAHHHSVLVLAHTASRLLLRLVLPLLMLLLLMVLLLLLLLLLLFMVMLLLQRRLLAALAYSVPPLLQLSISPYRGGHLYLRLPLLRSTVLNPLTCGRSEGLRRFLVLLYRCLRLRWPLLQRHPPTAAVWRVVMPARLPLLLRRWCVHRHHRLWCRQLVRLRCRSRCGCRPGLLRCRQRRHGPATALS